MHEISIKLQYKKTKIQFTSLYVSVSDHVASSKRKIKNYVAEVYEIIIHFTMDYDCVLCIIIRVHIVLITCKIDIFNLQVW